MRIFSENKKLNTLLYLWILIILLLLLVVASYTWFSLSQTPRVSDMQLHVTTGTGLKLALTPDAAEEDWKQELDFADMVGDHAPLKPVTWSQAQQSFLSIRYGLDGRMSNQWQPLTDEANANRDDSNGYYVVGTFYGTTDTDCTVSLAEAVELNEGENGAGTYVIGTPVWNEQTILHDDGGYGAESAIRLGFRITPVLPDGSQKPNTQSEFFIYEPNCDKHVSGNIDYSPTSSIDGMETLIDESHLFLQTASTWSEVSPVQRDVTMKMLGDFTSDTTLFSIDNGEIVKIQIYIWLEGQDIDCTNEIDDAQIVANVQFHTDYGEQSGMEEIPGNSQGEHE